MKQRKRSKRGVPNIVGVEYDYMSDPEPRCPLCEQLWPDPPSVLVNEELGIAIVDGVAFYCTSSQGRTLQVLSASLGRWLVADDLLLRAYSDLPDVDQPDDTAIIESAIAALRRRLTQTDYHIETRRGYGYRITKKKQKAATDEKRKHDRLQLDLVEYVERVERAGRAGKGNGAKAPKPARKRNSRPRGARSNGGAAHPA